MQLRNLLIATVISPEMLVALGTYAAYVHYPAFFEFIGSKLISDAENWKYIAALPLALVGWSIKVMSDIRNPSDKEQNKILYLWPSYPLLVGRLYVALAMSFATAATSISLLILGKELRPEIIGAVFVGSTAISLIVATGFFMARDKIKELLTRHI